MVERGGTFAVCGLGYMEQGWVLVSQVDVGCGRCPFCGGLWVALGGGREVEVHSVVGVVLPCIVCGECGRGNCGRPWGAFVHVWHLAQCLSGRSSIVRNSLSPGQPELKEF